tara:strand:+ start:225 stop:482 length:258 start_codon:yes stop_codon:yes gene_type:complete
MFVIFLSGCAQNTALFGPIYTFGTTGNSIQAGLSYGSDKIVQKYTGKSSGENIKELLKPNDKDAKLKKFLKKRIIQSRKKLNLSN